nr:unnamed protein product [Callosobruchus analis]
MCLVLSRKLWEAKNSTVMKSWKSTCAIGYRHDLHLSTWKELGSCLSAGDYIEK